MKRLANQVHIFESKMPDQIKRSQEYKEFRFRRRHDHFLRFSLTGATPQEVADTAKELGFNLNIKDLSRKSAKKVPSSQTKRFFSFFKHLF